jgi:hypothetical protein
VAWRGVVWRGGGMCVCMYMNLREVLTKAKFSSGNKQRIKPMVNKQHIARRPCGTYDKNQLQAPLTHTLAQCSCGETQLTEKYDNLQGSRNHFKWVCPNHNPNLATNGDNHTIIMTQLK